LRRAILESPWLGSTTLNMRFADTWGFSVAFQRSGLDRVLDQWPEFAGYLTAILEPSHNAFFLNPLVIFRGGGVEAHIDCSLRSYTAPLQPPYPAKVSVYYAQVPADLQGGQLVLTEGQRRLAEVAPENDMLVEFDGSLMHRVTPFVGSQAAELDRARVSLVCEQYRLDGALLSRIPRFHLESSRQFAEFFEKALEPEGFGNEA
jgi:hypothetical protein